MTVEVEVVHFMIKWNPPLCRGPRQDSYTTSVTLNPSRQREQCTGLGQALSTCTDFSQSVHPQWQYKLLHAILPMSSSLSCKDGSRITKFTCLLTSLLRLLVRVLNSVDQDQFLRYGHLFTETINSLIKAPKEPSDGNVFVYPLYLNHKAILPKSTANCILYVLLSNNEVQAIKNRTWRQSLPPETCVCM